MIYRKLSNTNIDISVISLGTWAFGNDRWWGRQDDEDSRAVLAAAIESGINLVDTAPVYGRGHSESVIGGFLAKNKLRSKVVLATKLGLKWEDKNPRIFHDLSPAQMIREADLSRSRLQTDYFDLYQVHWPDLDTPIGRTAETMRKLYEKGVTRAVGVSNYSLLQMREFMRYCPLHSLQPQYSLFERSIEKEILPFCIENNIAVLSYAPLFSGLLTGKFFLDNTVVPNDINRNMKKAELQEPRFSVNRQCLSGLREVAAKYGKTLAQLAINWNFTQKGITSAIVGSRRISQLEDNLGAAGWQIIRGDQAKIRELLLGRDQKMIN